MPSQGLREEKTRLRRKCAERLALLTDQELRAAGAAIAERVIASSVYRQAASLFIYVSTAREPDTRAIIEHAWAAGKKVFAPKCRGKGVMDAVGVFSWDDLAPGPMGILEPRSDVPAGDEIGLSIVPCVCAGRDGRRLGHGAGYYDRFLSLRPVPALCLCFHALLSENIPQSLLDVRMDAVMTEKGLFVSEKGKRFFPVSGQDTPQAI